MKKFTHARLSVIIEGVKAENYLHNNMLDYDCKFDNVPSQGWGGIGNDDVSKYVRYWEYGSTNLDGSPVDYSNRAHGSLRLDPVADNHRCLS